MGGFFNHNCQCIVQHQTDNLCLKKPLPVKCRHLFPVFFLLLLRKLHEYAFTLFMKSKN